MGDGRGKGGAGVGAAHDGGGANSRATLRRCG